MAYWEGAAEPYSTNSQVLKQAGANLRQAFVELGGGCAAICSSHHAATACQLRRHIFPRTLVLHSRVLSNRTRFAAPRPGHKVCAAVALRLGRRVGVQLRDSAILLRVVQEGRNNVVGHQPQGAP